MIGGGSENILHFGAVRMRVTGSGNLVMVFRALDDQANSTLATLAMSSATDREPRVLANFVNQRALLELSTTAIDETFRINRIIVFAKPLWTEYPG